MSYEGFEERFVLLLPANSKITLPWYANHDVGFARSPRACLPDIKRHRAQRVYGLFSRIFSLLLPLSALHQKTRHLLVVTVLDSSLSLDSSFGVLFLMDRILRLAASCTDALSATFFPLVSTQPESG